MQRHGKNQFYAVLSAVRDALSFLSSKKTITPHPHSSAVGRDPDEIALVLGKFGGGTGQAGQQLAHAAALGSNRRQGRRTEDPAWTLSLTGGRSLSISTNHCKRQSTIKRSCLWAQHELGLRLAKPATAAPRSPEHRHRLSTIGRARSFQTAERGAACLRHSTCSSTSDTNQGEETETIFRQYWPQSASAVTVRRQGARPILYP